MENNSAKLWDKNRLGEEANALIEEIKKYDPASYQELINNGLVDADGHSIPKEEISGDSRYNIPKKDHGFTNEEVDKVIDNNMIYSKAREELKNAQRRQVGYGMSKYPEPLTADSWTIIETLNHDIEETADSLHYKIMLREKLMELFGIEGSPNEQSKI